MDHSVLFNDSNELKKGLNTYWNCGFNSLQRRIILISNDLLIKRVVNKDTLFN